MTDINQIANEADAYSTRRKLNKPRYERLLQELVTFAEGRKREDHTRGIPWFIKDGIPLLEKATGEEIPHDVTEGSLAKWLEQHHPELREAFRG